MEYLASGIDQELCADEIFKDSKSQEYLCQICLNLVWDHQLCEKCEVAYCGVCIGAWLERNEECPNC